MFPIIHLNIVCVNIVCIQTIRLEGTFLERRKTVLSKGRFFYVSGAGLNKQRSL
jgi:hypothetical protein